MHDISTETLFSIGNHLEFEDLAIKVFLYQSQNVGVYAEFIKHLGINPILINNIEDIPFLPIEFFKSHIILDQSLSGEEIIFSSSGTTGMQQSKHYVSDVDLYEQSFFKAFVQYYGNIEDYIIIALLPSYLERGGSSLIYMCDKLIKESKDNRSGFYLAEYEKIKNIIIENDATKKVLLIGVSYALLDFAEQNPFAMQNCIVMETGGMKGRRKEMLREELHDVLCSAFQLEAIHSEYGMTELLSQAYSKGRGIFESPPWMKILIRDTHDPFSFQKTKRTGGINVIDLANLHSCSFIATQDLGKKIADNQFEVMGRFDNSDIRGCNLLVQ